MSLTERTVSRRYSPGRFNRLADVADAQRQQWGVSQTTQGVHIPKPSVFPTSSPLPRRHPWYFDDNGPTAGTVTLGKAYIGGVEKTITNFPGSGAISGVTSTTLYYVAIDFLNATATWGSGSSLPANTATVEYWHVLTLTCVASVISEIYNPWPCDIRALLNP